MANLNSMAPTFSSRNPPLANFRNNAISGSSTDDQSVDKPEVSNQTTENSLVVRKNSSSSSSGSRVTSISSRDSVVSIKHYDSLVGELRCPGCAKPMYPPIRLCETGHSICSYCTSKLANCPLCSGQMTETRSVTLEAIVSKAQFSCPNVGQGCMVRLPLELMRWHKSRCAYQLGDCFMGKVWGGCEWRGCEINWIDHCMEEHGDKIWMEDQASITWQYVSTRIAEKPVKSYYIFKVFGETFNLYQIYNKPNTKLIWTMICASKEPNINKKFGYEIEIYSPTDPSRVLLQRHGCHSEKDEDVLDDGRCINFNMGDVMRLLDKKKVLHYRVKVLELSKLPGYSQNVNALEVCKTNPEPSKHLPIDYTQTTIAGSNQKNIPADMIITRKQEIKAIEENSENIQPSTSNNLKNISEECEEEDDIDAEIRALIERKIEEDLLKKRKAMLKSQSNSINSIDKDIVTNNDLKRILMNEFSICDQTNELKLNSISKLRSCSNSRRGSRNKTDIEMDLFYLNQSASQPPSLPASPIPLQKVVSTKKVVELPKGGGVFVDRSYSID